MPSPQQLQPAQVARLRGTEANITYICRYDVVLHPLHAPFGARAYSSPDRILFHTWFHGALFEVFAPASCWQVVVACEEMCVAQRRHLLSVFRKVIIGIDSKASSTRDAFRHRRSRNARRVPQGSLA